jgi:hypothetical protein
MSPPRASHDNHKEGGVVAPTLPDGERAQGQPPSTLDEAHDVLWRQRPKRDADAQEWIAFHRHSAEVYLRTAKVDLRHHHEATQYAGLEIRNARRLEDLLGVEGDQA